MAPKYKLTYLNLMGLAEPIRFILEYSGADWEDCRIEKGPKVEEIGPFGKVPVLEVDGKKLHQSGAILRFLGKELKLAGDTEWDAAEIDMIIDTFGDMRAAFRQTGVGSPEEAAKKKAEFLKETVPYYLTRFEAIVKKNGGHFVNGKLTWADFYWAHLAVTVTGILGEEAKKSVATNFPALSALQKKIYELPAIKAWVAKRPVTDH